MLYCIVALFVVALLHAGLFDFETVKTYDPVFDLYVDYHPPAYCIGQFLGIVLFWSVVVFLIAPLISRLVCAVLYVKPHVVEVVAYTMLFYISNYSYFKSAGLVIP